VYEYILQSSLHRLRGHGYLFNDPKNDICHINKSTIKYKGFVFTRFLVQIYLLGSGTLRR